MAKINKFLVEYKEALTHTGVPVSDRAPSKAVIRKFVRIFKVVDDSRVKNMTSYPLVEIILIAFLAILGNASTWAEIERFGKKKERWLKKFLRLKNGIPSHDTFRRVFALIDTGQLQAATVSFLSDNLSAIRQSLGMDAQGYRHICVDGKEQRGTGRKYATDQKIRNLQTLHVYDASNEICLYSQAIDEKTNEIPVAQGLLEAMDLKGCIVTFDALHTQKKTIQIIAAGKGDYLGGIKGNQASLQIEAESKFTSKKCQSIKEKGTHYHETIEKSHNQLEIRRFYLASAKSYFDGESEWEKLRSLVCYQKYTYSAITGEKKTETRYYITSLKDVELSAQAIRGHWAIENNLHWHLDYSLMEDMNTTMDKTAFHNYTLLNKMVLSLCKLAQPVMGNRSIRIIRKEFGWAYEETLAELLNCFSITEIQNALEV